MRVAPELARLSESVDVLRGCFDEKNVRVLAVRTGPALRDVSPARSGRKAMLGAAQGLVV